MRKRDVADQLRTLGVAPGGVRSDHPEACTAIGPLARARDIVRQAVEELRREPLLFLHGPGEGCAECDEARAGISPNP
ncbi:MAG: hypothetical protein Q8L19_17410 [Reyranella sp.]|nr:hypothetical protein [Reyranella sp.]